MSASLRLALVLGSFAALGCGSGGIEGKYYNARSGEYAMELKGGKVTWIQGMEGVNLRYEVKGDSLYLTEAGGSEALTFGIESDGTLSLGILGSLTKKRP